MYWLQPLFDLAEPKPTFLNLRVRRRIKGRWVESCAATFVEQQYFNTWTQNRGQICPFDSSSMTYGKLAATLGCGREQVGIEPEAGDEADVPTDGSDQLDRREAGVGHDDDRSIWQPAFNLENPLAGPIR